MGCGFGYAGAFGCGDVKTRLVRGRLDSCLMKACRVESSVLIPCSENIQPRYLKHGVSHFNMI